MEAFLVSAGLVALAEIGDKTQLLAFVLAARFRRPLPIIAGIFAATIVNHSLAGAVGRVLVQAIGPRALRIALALSFFAMFLAEMGDKTQVATVALAARYESFYAVVAGTTLGMMLANVPAVLISDRLAGRLPIRLVHALAALIFVALGLAALIGDDAGLLR